MGRVASLTVTLLLWGLSATGFLSLERARFLAEGAVVGDMAEEMHEAMEQAAQGLQGAMQDVEEQVEDLAENVVENVKSGLGDQGASALENSMEIGAAGASYDYTGSSETGAGMAGGLEMDYEAEGLEAEHETGETGQLEYNTADYHSGEVASRAEVNAAYSSAAQDALSAGGGDYALYPEVSAETGQYEASVEQPEAVEVPTDPYLHVAMDSEEEEVEVEGQESHEEAAMPDTMAGLQNVNALVGSPLSRNVIGGSLLKQNIPTGNGLLAMPSPLPRVPGLSGMTASGSLGPVLNPSNSLASSFPTLPANLPSFPANLPPFPANLPPLPANMPPLPANLPPLPSNLPPLPSNLPPLPANLPALPNMPPLPWGLPPFPGFPGRRRKRSWGTIGKAAWNLGRTLFGKFGRTHATKSGSRVTQHYAGQGNYQTALKDFRSMKPENVKPINSGKVSGHTGKVGDYRVTLRDGSTKGESKPTISVHNEKRPGKVRKFRYNP